MSKKKKPGVFCHDPQMVRALCARFNEINAPMQLMNWPARAWELFFNERHILLVHHNHPNSPGQIACGMFDPEQGKP